MSELPLLLHCTDRVEDSIDIMDESSKWWGVEVASGGAERAEGGVDGVVGITPSDGGERVSKAKDSVSFFMSGDAGAWSFRNYEFDKFFTFHNGFNWTWLKKLILLPYSYLPNASLADIRNVSRLSEASSLLQIMCWSASGRSEVS